MTGKRINSKNKAISLAIALFLLVTVFILASAFTQPKFKTTANATVNQLPKQEPLQLNLTQPNSSSNATTFQNVSLSNNVNPSIDTASLTQQSSPIQNPFSYLYTQNQAILQVAPNQPAASNNNIPILLDTSQFATYTYSGYPVEQPDSATFLFSYPDNLSQTQIAGSDAITLNTHTIQRMTFDARFATPQVNALGFDEMAIFAASDTSTYKGIEFGVRLDLKDGFIYGYIQEPNGLYGDINFQTLKLLANDGVLHHFELVFQGQAVVFLVDGITIGSLGFPSGADYSAQSFSVLAVVHRFTDGWDSTGDSMTLQNLSITQQ